MSTTSHLLLISSIHVSDWLLFMSSYYMFIPSQPCFLHLLCNVCHSTFSPDLFIPNYRLRSPQFLSVSISPTFFHFFFIYHPYLLHLLYNVYHSTFYSDFFTPYYPYISSSVSPVPLSISIMSVTDFLSILSQPCLLPLLYNVYHSTFSSDFFTPYYPYISSSVYPVPLSISIMSVTDFLSILSQPCLLPLLYNVYHSTFSSDLFTPYYPYISSSVYPVPLSISIMSVTDFLSILSQPCLLPLLYNVYHSTFSSDFFTPYYPYISSSVSPVPLSISIMSVTDFLSILSQPCLLPLLYNVYHSTFSSDFFTPYYPYISSSVSPVPLSISIMSVTDFLSILSQPCLLPLLYNVYHSTFFSDFFTPYYPYISSSVYPVPLSISIMSVTDFLSILSQPPLLYNVHHLTSSFDLIGSPSSLLNTCPYHLSLASFIFPVMSTTPQRFRFFTLHNVSDRLSFISSY